MFKLLPPQTLARSRQSGEMALLIDEQCQAGASSNACSTIFCYVPRHVRIMLKILQSGAKSSCCGAVTTSCIMLNDILMRIDHSRAHSIWCQLESSWCSDDLLRVSGADPNDRWTDAHYAEWHIYYSRTYSCWCLLESLWCFDIFPHSHTMAKLCPVMCRFS